jgi:hypothetical protein
MYPIKLPLQRAVKRGGPLHKQLLNALELIVLESAAEGHYMFLLNQ